MKRRKDDDESLSSETTRAPKAAAGAAIAGVVRGAGGDPVAGALVSLTSDVGSPDIAQQTGEDGTFRFGSLKPGRYAVNVGGDTKKNVKVEDEGEYEVEVRG